MLDPLHCRPAGSRKYEPSDDLLLEMEMEVGVGGGGRGGGGTRFRSAIADP